jgi:NAD(P)-dependent dehydrogenase (short-subunit alcohol dehydrogenase family)
MQLDVNLASPIRLAQMAIGHWTQRKQKGCLIFVGSIAGYNATVASPLYHASKFGLLGFARSLGELKEAAGIRVSYMAPAQVKVRPLSPLPSPRTYISHETLGANWMKRRPCGWKTHTRQA